MARVALARRVARLALCAVLAGVAGGCSDSSVTPVDWWHGLEGGRIAEARPPPPDADAPYPNLGSVPARPSPPDAAAHARVAGGLVADRTNAVYDASVAPIPAIRTVAPPARPAALPTGDAEPSNASLAAANAAPAPPVPAPPVARKAAALPGPSAAAALPGDVRMPSMPDAPPPAPRIAGVNVPSSTMPTRPAATPPAPPPAAPVAGAAVAIPFAAGSAVLPAAASTIVKLLARERGAGAILVIGFGGAASTDAAAQSAALPLALDRARAVTAGLMTSGVPAASIRLAAEAQGSGAAARIVK